MKLVYLNSMKCIWGIALNFYYCSFANIGIAAIDSNSWCYNNTTFVLMKYHIFHTKKILLTRNNDSLGTWETFLFVILQSSQKHFLIVDRGGPWWTVVDRGGPWW